MKYFLVYEYYKIVELVVDDFQIFPLGKNFSHPLIINDIKIFNHECYFSLWIKILFKH